ncbi:hypothetical protein BU14_0025s0013 [Porphyra umbilicalis]|uniref:Uncharacterized protein n=1 Tax=Porphyra umbilicalis TaxID=2786 RepID=A0A1X6PJV8_PORUM|nr:hypothetical protein BU14_0025s0013 [Porphyra umbilicalis]|eukprot:OSX81131.1 hypothetical protein BU14_0025s0013 [Porphyra umbilicalis]
MRGGGGGGVAVKRRRKVFHGLPAVGTSTGGCAKPDAVGRAQWRGARLGSPAANAVYAARPPPGRDGDRLSRSRHGATTAAAAHGGRPHDAGRAAVRRHSAAPGRRARTHTTPRRARRPSADGTRLRLACRRRRPLGAGRTAAPASVHAGRGGRGRPATVAPTATAGTMVGGRGS